MDRGGVVLKTGLRGAKERTQRTPGTQPRNRDQVWGSCRRGEEAGGAVDALCAWYRLKGQCAAQPGIRAV